MTEIAIRNASLPEKMRYAEALAISFMLPEQYRKQPANVLWAIEYGETIGITAMAAITGVHMIEGKPTASAALISGLVRRAGHRLRSGYDAATRTGWAEIVRCDDPDFTFRSEWNVDRAIEAELVQVGSNGELIAKDSKGRSKPWKKFYPSMTKARAITEVARDACEEVLFGLHYTPEELGADTDDEGNLVVAAARAAFTTSQTPWQPVAPAASAPGQADEGEYAEVVGENRPAEHHHGPVDDEWSTATGQPLAPPAPGMPTATPEQIGKMGKLLKAKRGASSAQQANFIVSQLVRRPVGDVQTLSQSEAGHIIETLTAESDLTAAATADAVPDPTPVGTPNNPAITTPQHRALHALLNKAGYGNRAKGLGLLARYVGRPIESSDNLSKAEASTIINKLSNGELPPPAAPGPEGEGIGLMDVLYQLIDDAHTDEEFDQARADIEREHAEGGIGGDQLAALQAHWADVRNEKQAMAGAVT
jgi:hypothetical protein